MRNISFALTTDQVRNRTKTVTRRNGWRFLKAGDLLCAVEKSQGLKKGEKIKRICTIRVRNIVHEQLQWLLELPQYGAREVIREGFPYLTAKQFVDHFCKTHKGVTPASEVVRIEFEYIDAQAEAA